MKNRKNPSAVQRQKIKNKNCMLSFAVVALASYLLPLRRCTSDGGNVDDDDDDDDVALLQPSTIDTQTGGWGSDKGRRAAGEKG